MKVLEQLMTKTMTNTYVVIFFVGFTFRSLLSFQIYIYIEFTVCQSLFFPSPSLFPLRASTFGTDLYMYGYIPIRPYKIEIQITTGDESGLGVSG